MTAGDRIGFFLRAADRWGRRALAGQGTLLPANGFITSFFGCKRREAAHSWRFPQHAQRGRHACKVQADGMQATTQAGGRSTEPCNASGRASASRRCGPPRRAPSAQRGDCDRSRPAREARRFGVPTRHRAAKVNPAGTPHHRPVTRPRFDDIDVPEPDPAARCPDLDAVVRDPRKGPRRHFVGLDRRRAPVPGAAGDRGNLYVVTHIMIPKKLTDAERAIWQQLAAQRSS